MKLGLKLTFSFLFIALLSLLGGYLSSQTVQEQMREYARNSTGTAAVDVLDAVHREFREQVYGWKEWLRASRLPELLAREPGAKSFVTKPIGVKDFMRAVRVLQEYWLEVVALPLRKN